MRGRSLENVVAIPKVAFTGLTKQMILKVTNNSTDLICSLTRWYIWEQASLQRGGSKERDNPAFSTINLVLCSRGRNSTTSDPALW